MSLPLFINELSNTLKCDNLSAVKQSAIGFTRNLIKLSKIRKDVHLVHSENISSIYLSGHNLCKLLSGQDSRDYWDRIRLSFVFINDDQKYNYKEIISSIEENEYATINNKTCKGIFRAYKYDSLTISFNIDTEYDKELIYAMHYNLNSELNTEEEKDISVCNISQPEHIETHKEFIENYGESSSTSSLIYSCTEYVVHMYINDHNPPHIHVYDPNDKNISLARVNINNFDLMEGSKNVRPIKRNLMMWITSNQDSLKKSWELCQKGKHPIKIDP